MTTTNHSTRLCACGADTDSPALDQCERCEQKRDDTDYSEDSGYGPDYGAPGYDDVQPLEDDCPSCARAREQDLHLHRCGRHEYERELAREGSSGERAADLRTRRAIRDMHTLAVTAHADAVREHLA